MKRPRPSDELAHVRLIWGVFSLALGWIVSAPALAEPRTDADFDETAGVTLFAFDRVAIPYSQNLRLEMRSPARHPANPVVCRGPAGAPDAMGVQFYGSVIREGNRFRMWYVAQDDDVSNKSPSARWRPAYAESGDGVRWTKPSLGLVEFRGSRENNLIMMEPAPVGVVNLKVLRDAGERDPQKRYKISTHVYFRHNTRLGSLAPFASDDGLRWRLLSGGLPRNSEMRRQDLVLPPVHFEPCGGLYRWDGMYYACGQNAMGATRPYQGRIVRMYRSADFVNWSRTSSVGFIRATQHATLGAGHSREGEQTHEGISVWNRGNVLLGIYGRWHGATDWKDVTIDLGFVISNDGLNFREPAHEWTFLKRGDDGEWDQGGLLQGQGFENIGAETLIYYGAWEPRSRIESPRGGVGIATLPRDRFGDLIADETAQGPGDYQMPVVESEFITAPIPIKAGTAHRFFLNADGLGDRAALRIELLDDLERPLAGFAGRDAAVVRESGFHAAVSWGSQDPIVGLPDRIRIKATFEGPERTQIRFSALYVQASGQTK